MVEPIDQGCRAHQFVPSFMSIRPILAGIGVEEERAVAFVSSCQLILIFVLLVCIVAAIYLEVPRYLLGKVGRGSISYYY